MKIDALARKMSAVILASGLIALIGTGCSGSQQEEEKMEATPEEELQEEKAEPEEEAAEEAAVPEEVSPIAEVPSTPAPNMNTATDKSRVVRYVSKEEATVHGQPNEKAEPVGKLMKGDMILVVETNGWGKISDNMYIRLNSLSKKAVPRARNPAVWGKPAH